MRYSPAQGMSIEQSRAMFARVLSAWASDMLVLRSRRLDRPTTRRARAIMGGVGLYRRLRKAA